MKIITILTFPLTVMAICFAGSADSGQVRLGNGCVGLFEIPRGWVFSGNYGLSAEAAKRGASQGLFHEKGAELSVGVWTKESRPAAATVEEWMVRWISFLAYEGKAMVRVTEIAPQFNASRNKADQIKPKIEFEFDEAGETFKGIHSRIVILNVCQTAVVVTLRYFPNFTGERVREWHIVQDNLVGSVKALTH